VPGSPSPPAGWPVPELPERTEAEGGGEPDAVRPEAPPASIDWSPTGLDLARSVTREIAGRTGGGRSSSRRSRYRGATESTDRVERSGGFSGAAPDGRDPQAIGASVDRVVAEHGWGTDLAVAAAVARWPAVVGAAIAAHTAAESFRDGVLTVRADSTSWASEVRLMAGPIVAALAAELGDGRVLRIDVVGPSAPSWRFGARRVRGRGPRDTYG